MTRLVEIDYTNWKGVRRVRKILPIRLEFNTTGFYANRFCVRAQDLEEKDYTERSFDVQNIHSWKELE